MGGQIGREPLPLRAGGAAAAGRRALGVERNEMPRSDVEAVVALRWVTGPCAEVLVVARRIDVGCVAPGARAGPAVGEVLVVSHGRVGNRLHAAPAQVIGTHEGGVAAAVVLVIAQRQDAGETSIDEQIGRGQLAAAVRHTGTAVELRIRRVAGDVAGSGNDRIAARRGKDRGMRRYQRRSVAQPGEGQRERRSNQPSRGKYRRQTTPDARRVVPRPPPHRAPSEPLRTRGGNGLSDVRSS